MLSLMALSAPSSPKCCMLECTHSPGSVDSLRQQCDLSRVRPREWPWFVQKIRVPRSFCALESTITSSTAKPCQHPRARPFPSCHWPHRPTTKYHWAQNLHENFLCHVLEVVGCQHIVHLHPALCTFRAQANLGQCTRLQANQAKHAMKWAVEENLDLEFHEESKWRSVAAAFYATLACGENPWLRTLLCLIPCRRSQDSIFDMTTVESSGNGAPKLQSLFEGWRKKSASYFVAKPLEINLLGMRSMLSMFKVWCKLETWIKISVQSCDAGHDHLYHENIICWYYLSQWWWLSS